jgi:nucleotide-binding universal stress UspA family protein
LTAVLVVEDLRNQIRRIISDLADTKARLATATAEMEDAKVGVPSIPAPTLYLPPEDEDDINRSSWNKAIRAAAREAAHPGYDDGDGTHIRIAEAILDLRR